MSERPDESRFAALREWSRTHRFLLSAATHALLFAASWFLAFGLAYNFQSLDRWFDVFFLPLLPIVVIFKLIVFVSLGLHRAAWRYVSIRDFISVSWASWLGFAWVFCTYFVLANLRAVAALFGVTNLQFDPFQGRDFPDSVLLLDFAGTIALVCGARILFRLYYEEVRPSAEGAAPRLLILGAGNAGENLIREIMRQPILQYQPVGFLDDDRSKWRAQIHGVEVLGPIERIKEVCLEQNVDEILIAMPSASRAQIRRVVELCKGTSLRFKTLPAMSDLITGRMQVQQIRDVDINDLLGRAPVTLDSESIAGFIRDRVVMVTGAGGSIGAEMCRQIARFGPRQLLLVEQAEENLFEIDRELRGRHPEIATQPLIADICDSGRMERLFAAHRPSAVFHAAAHKHVPMMEANPGEAIKNNIAGTRMVADLAARHGCEKFVMISTDKAVNPTSVMGASKRIAEMYIQALNARSSTQFVTVRFGNVLGSSGSVVPIFKEQIARGGPVTVTHPDMVRYFMTIPEASQLVLQAASMGDGGEIFVLDMGEPVKIVDLARDLITLSGFRPGEDIEIVFSGIRPGEKLYEELLISGEDVAQTRHPKIGVWRGRSEAFDAVAANVDRLVHDADSLSREQARARFKELVPEFYVDESSSQKSVRPASVQAIAAAAEPRIAPA